MLKPNITKYFYPTRIKENLAAARGLASAEVGAVIKADAYGVGVRNALPILMKNGVKSYFVQSLAEGIEARGIIGSAGDIFVFDGVFKGQEAAFLDHNLVPICISLGQIENWNGFAAAKHKKLRTGIHFDTGMNRNGLGKEDTLDLILRWKKIAANLAVDLYITHLFEGDDLAQLARFDKITSKLPHARRSAIVSESLHSVPRQMHLDIVRIGEDLYTGAVRVDAKILQVRLVQKGAKIGYFGAFSASHAMKLAIVAIGYKDGYPRGLSKTNDIKSRLAAVFGRGGGATKAYVVIGGYRCPLVGMVSMNCITVDASEVPLHILDTAEVATVFGGEVNFLDFRASHGRVPFEIMTDLTRPDIDAGEWVVG